MTPPSPTMLNLLMALQRETCSSHNARGREVWSIEWNDPGASQDDLGRLQLDTTLNDRTLTASDHARPDTPWTGTLADAKEYGTVTLHEARYTVTHTNGTNVVRPGATLSAKGQPALSLPLHLSAALSPALRTWLAAPDGRSDAALHLVVPHAWHGEITTIDVRYRNHAMLIDTVRNGTLDARSYRVPCGAPQALLNALDTCALSVTSDINRIGRIHQEFGTVLQGILSTSTGGTPPPRATLSDGLLQNETYGDGKFIKQRLTRGRAHLSSEGVLPGFEPGPNDTVALHSQGTPVILHPDWCLMTAALLPEWQAGYAGQLSFSWTPGPGEPLHGTELQLNAGPDSADGKTLILELTQTGTRVCVPLHPEVSPSALGRMTAALHRANRRTIHARGA